MIFERTINSEDGRTFTHHVIVDRQVDLSNFTITPIIRSWDSLEQVGTDAYIEFFAVIQHSDFAPSYLENLETQVLSLPWDVYVKNAPKPEPAPPFVLSEAKNTLTLSIDADVDTVYKLVIGNRLAEYQLAEREATEFKNNNYSGTVPSTVQSWATAQNQTAQWAADSILAQANAWINAQNAIRSARLATKAAVQNAQNESEINAVKNNWKITIQQIRQSLGV